MIPCRISHARLLDVAHGKGTDASRLDVETHLESCVACRHEYAQWRLVDLLKRHPPPRLNHAAERRILDHLTATAGRARARSRGGARRRLPYRAAGVSVLLLALGALWAGRRHGGWQGGTEASFARVAEGEIVDAARPGALSFGGAEVNFRAGTKMILHPDGRALYMSKGEVDVEVKPGLPGRFRVKTPRFIVEVLGTRFIVTTRSVRTLHGRVRVLDLGEHELAALPAGETWDVPDEPSPSPSPSVPPSPARTQAPPPAADHRAIGALLVRSRVALARGDSRQARALAQRGLRAGPTARQVAALDLVGADSLLVERRTSEAIAQYRRVARRSPRSAEAEAAQFAVGQLLFERGANTEATRALERYLAHYPRGCFVREAREHLAEIDRRR